jgi:hypothetical protein
MVVLERFEQKFMKSDSGCWEWVAALRNGYGAFKYNGKLRGAHRVSFELYKGPIPLNLNVCHTCDNRKCVNPNHLFLGSYLDNYNDAVLKGRINKDFLSSYPRQAATHPNNTTYRNGCRCDACQEVQKVRMQKYRGSLKLKIAG